MTIKKNHNIIDIFKEDIWNKLKIQKYYGLFAELLKL
jgi:hypothetical protein